MRCPGGPTLTTNREFDDGASRRRLVDPRIRRAGPVTAFACDQPGVRPISLYNTILCPTEFSDPSIRALEHAVALAEETDARLVLLHVIEGLVDEGPVITEASHFSVPEYFRHLEREARARLTSALPEEARVWCHPEERVMFGKPYRVILDVAGELDADLIVMGVHGKGALNRRLFGSTTHHVIREAHCPVLTLRG
jgi:nucleotide-binding universal stress UspA family protein